MKFRVPVGTIPRDELPAACDTMLEKIRAAVAARYGTDVSQITETILLQNQVEADNQTVSLRTIRKQLVIRTGNMKGVNVVVTWSRDNAKDVAVAPRSHTRIEDWAFWVMLLIAGAAAMRIFISNGGGYVEHAFLIFLAVLPIVWLPYFALRALMAIRGRDFRESIAQIVASEIGVQET